MAQQQPGVCQLLVMLLQLLAMQQRLGRCLLLLLLLLPLTQNMAQERCQSKARQCQQQKVQHVQIRQMGQGARQLPAREQRQPQRSRQRLI
jgi:hypothetical protein